MGIREDIIEGFFSRLSSDTSVPKPLIEKLRQLIDSGTFDETSLQEMLYECVRNG